MDDLLVLYMDNLKELLDKVIQLRLDGRASTKEDLKDTTLNLKEKEIGITTALIEDIWDELEDDDIKFLGKPVKSEFKYNYSVVKKLKNYEILRDRIVEEVNKKSKKILIFHSTPLSNTSEDEKGNEWNFDHLRLKQTESVHEETKENLNFSFKVIMDDSDIEEEIKKFESELEERKQQKFHNLQQAIKISKDIADINSQFCLEINRQGEILEMADFEAIKAVKESGKVLDEVKEGSKGNWDLFAKIQAGLFFGLVIGPKGIISSILGGISGFLGFSKVSKMVNEDVDKFQKESFQKVYDAYETEENDWIILHCKDK